MPGCQHEPPRRCLRLRLGASSQRESEAGPRPAPPGHGGTPASPPFQTWTPAACWGWGGAAWPGCTGSEHHGPIGTGRRSTALPSLYWGAAHLPGGVRAGTGCWLGPPCPALLLAGQGRPGPASPELSSFPGSPVPPPAPRCPCGQEHMAKSALMKINVRRFTFSNPDPHRVLIIILGRCVPADRLCSCRGESSRRGPVPVPRLLVARPLPRGGTSPPAWGCVLAGRCVGSSRNPLGRGLPAGGGRQWEVYWEERMHRLSNNSICSLRPPGPRRRGGNEAPARSYPTSLPHSRFPWQRSLGFGFGPAWWVGRAVNLGGGAHRQGAWHCRHRAAFDDGELGRALGAGQSCREPWSCPGRLPSPRGAGGASRFLARRAAFST